MEEYIDGVTGVVYFIYNVKYQRALPKYSYWTTVLPAGAGGSPRPPDLGREKGTAGRRKRNGCFSRCKQPNAPHCFWSRPCDSGITRVSLLKKNSGGISWKARELALIRQSNSFAIPTAKPYNVGFVLLQSIFFAFRYFCVVK